MVGLTTRVRRTPTCAIPPEGALADGAAYDPATNRGARSRPRRSSTRPFGAVAGGTMYLLIPSRGATGPEFLAYDIAADTWTRLAAPAGSTWSLASSRTAPASWPCPAPTRPG